MPKWRDVKQNKIQSGKNIETIKSSKNDLASLPSRLKAFFTDTFLITTPIFYIVIYLIMGSGAQFAENRSLGWGIIFAIHSTIILIFWLKNGQTPGLKAYDIKLVDNITKQRVSVLQVLIRYLYSYFLFPFLIRIKKLFKIFFQTQLLSTINNAIFQSFCILFFLFCCHWSVCNIFT
jgi:uncharacterized RDD family membrane protein YckC